MVSVRVKLHDFREPTGRRKDGPILPGHSSPFNLETAVGRKKAVKDIGVHGEIKKVVVTLGLAQE